MRTNEYHLHRIKFIKPAQANLFGPPVSAREMFEAGLAERPTIGARGNNAWHIGNIEHVTADAGRFAVGRITKATVEKYDINTGDFTDLVDDSGPYTFVYFDSARGFLGIGKKARVANDVQVIARQIQRLMSSTTLVRDNEVAVRVDKIPDPENFLEKLYSAYAVKKFRATFTGPNPVDADELFQRPMSYYCQQLSADQGSVVVSGRSLNEDVVATVAKSTAATGNTATAIIQPERHSPTSLITFNGDAKRVIVETDLGAEQTLRAIQSAYGEVRG